MDRIRRRIKKRRRKTVLQGIRALQNQGQTSKQPCNLTLSSLKNEMSALLLVTSVHSYALRTLHSQHHQDQQSTKSPFDYSLLEGMRQSLLISTEKHKSIKVKRKNTVECHPASAKHLNIRLHNPLLNSRNNSIDDCSEGKSGCPLKPWNPAPKVFILQTATVQTEPNASRRQQPAKPGKRFSLAYRRTYTVPPLRKCSITAWESPGSPLF